MDAHPKIKDSKWLLPILKEASIALQELRTNDLAPKQYYELYILVFDILQSISNYLLVSNLDLLYAYELIQYSGNIIPRLYLLITVGSTYLKYTTDISLKKEILNDMIEMSKGVQTPIKGLFLRYYLSQSTKLCLSGETQFDSHYIIKNFIEMNKMWVRLSYNHSIPNIKNYRQDLKILIGYQFVRLSELSDDLIFYKNDILPQLLYQIEVCNEPLSQNYLFDVICNVFTDSFHLETLDILLKSLLKVNPNVSISNILINFIQRFINYNFSIYNEEIDSNIIIKFINFLNDLNNERPDIPINEYLDMINKLIEFSLCFSEKKHSFIDDLLLFLTEKLLDFNYNLSIDDNIMLFDLLTFKNMSCSIPIDSNFYYSIFVNCKAYKQLLMSLSQSQSKTLLDVSLYLLNFLTNYENDDKFINNIKIKIISVKELNEFLFVLYPILITNKCDTITKEKLSKFIHIIILNLPINLMLDSIISINNFFFKNCKKELLIYVYPTIINNFWKILSQTKKLKIVKIIFNNILRSINDITRILNDDENNNDNNDKTMNNDSDKRLIFFLILENAKIANLMKLNEITYDFFILAIDFLQDNNIIKKMESIIFLIQSLQLSKDTLSDEYFNKLSIRCIMISSKLVIKKSDQCRLIYLSSHLFDKEDITQNNSNKRVIECFQKSLKIADSILDNTESLQLMIEILNKCLYYFIKDEETFSNDENQLIAYINGLFQLIKTNLKLLENKEEEQVLDNSNNKLDIVINPIDGKNINCTNKRIINNGINEDDWMIPVHNFQKVCDFVKSQQDIDEKFKLIRTR